MIFTIFALLLALLIPTMPHGPGMSYVVDGMFAGAMICLFIDLVRLVRFAHTKDQPHDGR